VITMLKFYADWCAPCTAMTPLVEEVKKKFPHDLIVTNVNIDDNAQLRAEYYIRSIPAFVLIKDRKEIARNVGIMTASEMEDWIHEQRNL
jgi:thioredoxin 1